MMQFYASLLGGAPYPALTLAVSESETPGGHGPGYVALLDQTLVTSRLVWHDDPVNFREYQPFMLAHEIAHQWWGQAVNGKNYHERWISEGLAQYFAALYAQRDRGDQTLADILRRMQRSAIEASPQGPIALGSRLGQVRGDSRVLRAVLYNKSAMVLHMLRRLIGDEAFIAGLRDFYNEFRFRKAGTDDFRRAMERASGRNLHAFVDGWILGSAVPRLRVSRTTAADELRVTFEHTGQVLPVPVTVTLVYADGTSEDVVVPVTEAKVSRALPLRGALRDVKIDDDHAALATFQR
jgi:aminopeptidase N